jgi:hypothetical protein
MPDGTIFSNEFETALSVTLSDGWYITAEAGKPDALSIYGPEESQLLFTNFHYVFDPSYPSEAKELPAPENAEEWVS